ncbi:hypothetical protein N7512_008569 [Penicillium capsulatum]|nr:hypothetical protein N7512_008569 [Penicillium capsulatum]
MKLGEKPGVEGTRTRGAVDQYPVIVTLDSSPSSTPFDDPNPDLRCPPAILEVARLRSTSNPRPRCANPVRHLMCEKSFPLEVKIRHISLRIDLVDPVLVGLDTARVISTQSKHHLHDLTALDIPLQLSDQLLVDHELNHRAICQIRPQRAQDPFLITLRLPRALQESQWPLCQQVYPHSLNELKRSSGSDKLFVNQALYRTQKHAHDQTRPSPFIPMRLPLLRYRSLSHLLKSYSVLRALDLASGGCQELVLPLLHHPHHPDQRLGLAVAHDPILPMTCQSALVNLRGVLAFSRSSHKYTTEALWPKWSIHYSLSPFHRHGGHQDWSTLKGLTHLDICPSCMSQIGTSRFRDFFIPSLPKLPNQKTRCAFANAWARLAWTQMVKKKHDSLEMLYQMTRPPPGARPCSGRILTDQPWHRIVDPETGMYLPRFHICSSCARNVRVLMPAHRDTFQPCPEPQERVCDFVTTSPRFIQFIDLLDSAAARAEADATRRPDPREFLAYARRKVVLRDCRRDRPTLGTWHYIPSMPEFSVCEDCYDEVVWPLAKSHHPIARMFSTSMRLLPGDGPNRCREASCQLYSGRMRARFRDAVAKDDLSSLRSVALRRFEAERRFKDRREELAVSEKKGYDCSEEVRKAIEEWRRWE